MSAGTWTAPPGRRVLRVGRLSRTWRPRTVAVSGVLVAAATALTLVSLGRGELPLSVAEVAGVLAGGGDDTARLVVLELRLPRLATGALVGFALGLAGAITQAVARNPLASPDLLGITAGAAAVAVTLIVFGGGATGGLLALLGVAGLPVAALAGGLLAAVAVYLLAWRDGIDGFRLALVGLGVSAVGVAWTSYLLVRADLVEATQATVWLTGSLNGRGWEHAAPLAAAVLLALALVTAVSRRLLPIELGTDSARALGVGLQSSLALSVLVAVVLAAVATAAAGPVGFVALMAPQVARRLVRSAGPPPVVSALAGMVLVVGADLAARTALPVELPVGIVTAVIGAPYLLHLIVAHNRRTDA